VPIVTDSCAEVQGLPAAAVGVVVVATVVGVDTTVVVVDGTVGAGAVVVVGSVVATDEPHPRASTPATGSRVAAASRLIVPMTAPDPG
jgi:hypothetical protein